MNKEQDVIEAAKSVNKIWLDKGQSIELGIALANMHKSILKLHEWRHGRREEVTIRERW